MPKAVVPRAVFMVLGNTSNQLSTAPLHDSERFLLIHGPSVGPGSDVFASADGVDHLSGGVRRHNFSARDHARQSCCIAHAR